MDGLNKSMYDIGSDSAFAILARSQELAREGKDVINLGIGQPDFPTPINVVDAAVKALKDGHHGYTSSNGIYELRKAVADDFFAADESFCCTVSTPELAVIEPESVAEVPVI